FTGAAIVCTEALARCGCRGAAAAAAETEQDDTGVVNARCPIMGTALNQEAVPPELTRIHKGQKVGFCCGGCLPAWERLSEAEKDSKLSEAIDN
ncbi:MAG: hypothetical protein ACYTF6_11685, partial [Planctomycetota bacterium]